MMLELRNCLLRILLFSLIIIRKANVQNMHNELKMVHVIYRHGERTPSIGEASTANYPKDPHLNFTYFPVGHGGLINAGKLTMYNLGVFLRRRYNSFLGDLYYPNIAKVRSTYSYRAMISAELVNVGLFPPNESQLWNKDLPWLPIPVEYEASSIDSLMWSYKCPLFKDEYERVLQSEEIQKKIEPHRKFFDYLQEHTGKNVTKPQDVFFIYHTLESQKNNNLTLPSWTEGYFPDGEMYDVTLLEYDISNWGDLLKRIYGGPLLRDILKDYKKFMEGTDAECPKIALYSGHESNICSVLKALGLWTPHIPDFGSAVIFELYRNNSSKEFGIQILYNLGKSETTIPLTLPGCPEICPVIKFASLLSNVIPKEKEQFCQNTVTSGDPRSSFVFLSNAAVYITLTCKYVFCSRGFNKETTFFFLNRGEIY